METGIYHTSVSDYQTAKNLGFSLVHGINLQHESAELDIANSLGLKVFIHKSCIPADISYLHPAIKYWYLDDEPDIHDISPSEILKQHNYFKSKDPMNRDTLLMVSPISYRVNSWLKLPSFINYFRYRNSCDVIATDKYSNPDSIKNNLFWNFLPAIGKKKWFAAIDIHRRLDQIFNSAKVIFDSGASGLLCYAWYDQGWNFDLNKRSDVQKELEKVNSLAGKY